MHAFTAHRLRFVTEVRTPVELNEHQGSAIRGALYHALLDRFCTNREAPECALCPLAAACPVAFLVSTMRPESDRGRDIPRPFTVQPPSPAAATPWSGRTASSSATRRGNPWSSASPSTPAPCNSSPTSSWR
jgi:hypothetical protein